jgi:putative endonuclease
MVTISPVVAYYVYILASGRNGTLYVGMTNDLVRRIHEHRIDAVDGFTKKYRVHSLVYFETFDDPRSAIEREKKLKRWRRDWKIALFARTNPKWRDLFDDIAGG